MAEHVCRRVGLYEAELHYEPGLAVHTATSGRLTQLTSLFLVIESDGHTGLAELRINAEYLTGLSPNTMRQQVLDRLCSIDWTESLDHLAAHVSTDTEMPALLHALIETALLDCLARIDGTPLSTYLGGPHQTDIETNQCIFWCDRAAFEERAKRFVSEGFHDLKVRVGIGEFEEDVRRILWLKDQFSETVGIAADINGTWSAQKALAFLTAVESAKMDYVEQPTPAGDHAALQQILEDGGVPVMVDEGATSSADIETLIQMNGPLRIHLKAFKFGGPSRLLRAAKRLEEAAIPFMMGQMNEGGIATALAAHCALATGTPLRELYGAYGLISDPGSGISYDHGCVLIPDGPGLGMELQQETTNLIWEYPK